MNSPCEVCDRDLKKKLSFEAEAIDHRCERIYSRPEPTTVGCDQRTTQLKVHNNKDPFSLSGKPYFQTLLECS